MAATGITKARFASLLEPYMYQVYEVTYEKGDDIIPTFFDVYNSKLSKETVTGVGAMGLMKPWNGTVAYDSPNPLWDKTYTHRKYSTGITIERDIWDDAQYGQARDRVNSAILGVYRTRQLHATSLFDGAFATTYSVGGETFSTVGPDSVCLCSASHPYSPSVATTQSNAGSTALSIDAIESTRIAMMNFVDDRGQKLMVIPDTIVVPPALEMKAHELVDSVGRADTANRADNMRKGAYNIVTLPLLADSNNWFMVDTKLAKQYVKWFERRKPIPERDEDFDTEFLKWKLVGRWTFGFHHWCWIYGHAVA